QGSRLDGDARVAGDQQAGQARADDERRVEHREVQRQRARKVLPGHQAGDERLPGRVVEGGGGGEKGVERVEGDERLPPGEGEAGQRRGEDGHHRLRGEYDL